jgi:hypothetical protein
MKKDGNAPLWTNSAFGGMPAFQIYSKANGNLTIPVYKSLFLWAGISDVWSQVFAAMLCMYFMLFVMGTDWRVGLFGAITFGITTYNVDILEAGHTTKMAALALSPGLLAGVVLIFSGRLMLGGGLAALFLAMQLYANHVQITYYTLLIVGLYVMAEGVRALKSKAWILWSKAVGVLVLGLALGFASNLSRLWSTYEYSQETIRGKSELSAKSGRGSGLDPEYQFGWSYGIGESLTLIVPRAYGGGANEVIKNTGFLELITKGASSAEKAEAAAQTSAYYYNGAQPFVGTAIYFGAIVCFLFLLGAFLVPGSIKWWLVTGGFFSLTLAWGSNFFLNYVWNDLLPMFNKFRAVSMALGLGQLCFAALAALSLQKFFSQDIPVQKKQRALYIATTITILLCLMAGFSTPSVGPNDSRLAEQLKYPGLASLLADDRADLARSDAFRSMGFIALVFLTLWYSLKGRLKAAYAVMMITAFALADHWGVCNRNVYDAKYENKKTIAAPPSPQPFDEQIKADKDLSYRVLDLSRGGITGNATTSYFHKSLSGYHAAKLQRFQEVVDTFLNPNLVENLHLVGMLNGKYVVNQKGEVIRNDKACGNAWFVPEFKLVQRADQELAMLGSLDPRKTAVIQESQAPKLRNFKINPDTTATIGLSAYHPDKMEYTYSATSEQLAVFSEIYYPPAKGWTCYLNGKKTSDFFKVNYLLRGMTLPPGKGMKLEMRFEPKSYYTGGKIAFAASVLTFLLFLGGIWLTYRNKTAVSQFELLHDFPKEETKPAATVKKIAKRK